MSNGKENFHIDRSISVGHIFTTVTMVVALVVWGMRIEGRVEMNSLRIEAQEVRITREVERSAQQSAQIRQSLERIENKLDRYVERPD